METARLLIDLMKVVIWPVTLISIALIFRRAIASALEQRDVRFEALGMNVEITRQAEAAAEALAAGSTSEEGAPRENDTESQGIGTLSRDQIMQASRRVLSQLAERPSMRILLQEPVPGLVQSWNEVNSALGTVTRAFGLGRDPRDWPRALVEATGDRSWLDIGRSWALVRSAMELFAHPVDRPTGRWVVTEGAPPVAGEVARLLIGSMRTFYERLIEEVQYLSASDRDIRDLAH